MLFKGVFSSLFLFFSLASGQEEYVRGENPQADAIRDMQTGFAGLQQAASDPVLMAQLMQDLQDPVMMAEAKKMMESPEFKKQMKEFENSKEFKEAVKKTKKMMEDPQTAARMEAQVEHMVQRGQKEMKKGARNTMADVMQAMNDPAIMQEAMKMMKDPKFAEQMRAMQNDPEMRRYMQAMQEMMADPATRSQFEQITNSMKAQLPTTRGLNYKSKMAHPKVSNRASSVPSFKVMDVLQRANELQAEGHRVIHCEVGQPASGAPKTVANAAKECLESGHVMGYTDAFGLFDLREKISDLYKNKYGLEPVDIKRIVVTTGSSGAFLLAFTACFDVGDTVAVASSGYPCYRNILGSLGVNLANVPINEEFKLTATELRVEIDRRKQAGEDEIKGLILSSPSNPTGAMLSPHELKELCALCDEESIQFLSDEIYHGISYGKEESTALSYSQNTIIINSFSKYYSMSGWRLGWMIIPQHLVEPINALQQNMFINAPTISQLAACHCWRKETIDELEGHISKYRESRQIILNELAEIKEIPPKNIAPADGGFYVYVDLGDKNVAEGYGSVEMCKAFLEEFFVAFTPGNDFEDPNGNLGDRRFRISYSGGVDAVKEALNCFRRFFPKWLEKVKYHKELKR